jgi:uncharacterized membrane protein YebE (DUF533 family)
MSQRLVAAQVFRDGPEPNTINMKTKILSILTVSGLVALSSCTQQGAYGPNTQRNALTGAALGGVAGGIVGHRSGETAAGALIGAGVGAAAGAAIGNQQDQQQGYVPPRY